MSHKHQPVLLEEAVRSLNLGPGHTVVDGTLGSGGHAREILRHIGQAGRLIALDQDPEAIERCRKVFEAYENVDLHRENFRNIDRILERSRIPFVNAVLLDLGFSSDQLEAAGRGFSFERPGPLDMRMDPLLGVTAADLVAALSQQELERLFRRYGEERQAGRFARRICEARKQGKIQTTEDLARVIVSALPGQKYSRGEKPGWARRHPATRVFQALRIAVNDELGSLEEALPKLWEQLAPGGRISVISFHSLEDRIVKHRFRQWAREGGGRLVYKKPLTASDKEIKENSRARSAKLRTLEKNP